MAVRPGEGRGAGEGGFRLHDFRHNIATKTLRETENLRLVQRLFNHSKVSTIVKCAHVIDAEVAAALQAQAEGRVRKVDLKTESPHTNPQNDTPDTDNALDFNRKSG